MSDYCAYSHFSAMIGRSREDWLVAMIDLLPADYELYFDDSGTDQDSDVAVAACYISPKLQWDEFTKNWNCVKAKEGFDFFHMTDFMVNPEKHVLPYCDWDDAKKWKVYGRLTNLIRTRAFQGFAFAVKKSEYDKSVPDEMRRFFGKDHYVWAIKVMLIEIENWREKFGRTRPMQYVFSNVPKGKGTRGEIMDLWDLGDDDDLEKRYGIVEDGYGFQNMRSTPPLQAADILAWNMLDHVNNVILKGRDDIRDLSKWFYPLRFERPMLLLMVGTEDMQRFAEMIAEHKKKTGRWPSKRVERRLLKEQRRKAKAAGKQM